MEDSGLVGIGAWRYDPLKNLYSACKQCCELRGLELSSSSEGFTPLDWSMGVHSADRKRVESALNMLRNGSRAQLSVHYRVWSNETRWRWILTRAAIEPVDINEGGTSNKLHGISGFDIDVSEIYEELPENKRLREEAERLEIALASAEQGLWYVNFRNDVRSENNTWRTMRGYAADSEYSSKRDWEQDIHPDDYALVMNFDNVREDRASDVLDYTYRQRHADGTWRWIWSRGKIIQRDEKNRPVEFVGTDSDITHIKEVETRLERLSNTLEVAVQTADMGVWEWAIDSALTPLDSRTCEIFGIPVDSQVLTQNRFLSLVHPDDQRELESVLSEVADDNKDINVAYRIIHPERGVRYLEMKATRQLSVAGLVRYVGIVWDITDRVKAERERVELVEKLSDAQRLQAIDQIAGGIAHDVNNLLAIISGNAELMAMSLPKESSYLSAILSASQSGAELTQGLLAFSRKQSLKPVPVDLRKLVDKLHSMLGKTLGSVFVLSKKIQEDVWLCYADALQLDNALINLVINARDSMDQTGGTITVTVSNIEIDESLISLTHTAMQGEFVQVSVSDTGAGMSKEVMDKAIEPFFTTKSVGQGHGLGLSMIFGFVKQSNGHMAIDSVEGQGTTVSLCLPRYNGIAEEEIFEKKSVESLPRGEGQFILLVEDEPSLQKLIANTMTYLGYNPVCADNADDALAKLNHYEQKIKLLVSDVMLPDGMDGFELGAEIRKRFQGIRILYISGYAQDALEKSGPIDKDVFVMRKPFSVDQLAQQISSHLLG